MHIFHKIPVNLVFYQKWRISVLEEGIVSELGVLVQTDVGVNPGSFSVWPRDITQVFRGLVSSSIKWGSYCTCHRVTWRFSGMECVKPSAYFWHMWVVHHLLSSSPSPLLPISSAASAFSTFLSDCAISLSVLCTCILAIIYTWFTTGQYGVLGYVSLP